MTGVQTCALPIYVPEDETVTCPIMAWEKLTEARLEEVLTAYKADIPLGMIREENDFRISVAGAFFVQQQAWIENAQRGAQIYPRFIDWRG